MDTSSNRKIRGWVGPGVVVCVNAQNTSVWVSMRGVVIKCSMDRVRRATDEEWLGAELIRVLSRDALQHMRNRGLRGYVDTDNEEPPPAEQEGESDANADMQQLIPDPQVDLPAPVADNTVSGGASSSSGPVGALSVVVVGVVASPSSEVGNWALRSLRFSVFF